jgi:HAD superfamily phosphoserine phosphatase-like hydrolase
VLPFFHLFYAGFYYLLHTYCQMGLAELHRRVFDGLLAGRSLDSIERHVSAFIEEDLCRYFYAPAVDALRRAQHLGHHTLIVSNSPSFLVGPIAELFQVDEWRSTQYAIDPVRRLSGIAALMQGKDKAQCVREIALKLGVGKEEITAYSDSYLDLPLFQEAGTSVAVNPDRRLREVSKERNWRIL